MPKRSPDHSETNSLKLCRLGIDTYQEPVVYMRSDCHVCRSEGFGAQSRVLIATEDTEIIATLNVINDGFLKPGEAGLSEAAWHLLAASEGDTAIISHPQPLESLSHVRAKIYGNRLSDDALQAIIRDIVKGRYADVHLASFITACAGDALDQDEIRCLTRAMVDAGERLSWDRSPIVDKHCVGGLPGNRTTPIVVSIAAACGLTMPKTSSRAITSPAGTADAMEAITRVDLSVSEMRAVVEREGACMVWGGAMQLSPADDILIRVERALDVDSDGQLIASVLSKKIAAGSTHVILDLPVGPTAKVRSEAAARRLAEALEIVGRQLELKVVTLFSDGSQPVGRGIGPALEARDVLAVLQCLNDAPQDLRNRSLDLAGHLLELAEIAKAGSGRKIAETVLDDGSAWRKFQAICEAQGGFRAPTEALYSHVIEADRNGRISSLDNRKLARVAKLAGAPADKAAGLEIHKKLETPVVKGEPLYTIYAESKGALLYAKEYADRHNSIIKINEANQ